MACRLADELGLPRGSVLACVAAGRADRAEKDDLADTWRALAKKMGVTVALVLIGVSLHNPFHGAIAGVAGPIYTYAPTGPRRLARWALQALSRCVPALGLTLALAACASGAPWSGADVAREVAYQAALSVDCAQTRYGSSHASQHEEGNHLLPRLPSKATINGTCLGVGVGHWAISDWFAAGARYAWQGITIGVELWAIDTNRMAGVRLEF